MNKNKDMKVLVLDIESSPNLGYSWGKWEQNIIAFKEDWYIMSIAYKWLGEKTTHVIKLNDYVGYRTNKNNDKRLLLDIHDVLMEADAVVAHNGQSFDMKKINARFIYHGMKPTSPYKVIDTKLVAKKHFKFDSNSLNDLCKFFQLGKKEETGGFDLWLQCMAGDDKAWSKMARYNKQDVVLLEKLYLEMLPWMSHPNRNLYLGTLHNCPNCGSSNCQRRGSEVTATNVWQRWQCQSCGKWSKNINDKVNR